MRTIRRLNYQPVPQKENSGLLSSSVLNKANIRIPLELCQNFEEKPDSDDLQTTIPMLKIRLERPLSAFTQQTSTWLHPTLCAITVKLQITLLHRVSLAVSKNSRVVSVVRSRSLCATFASRRCSGCSGRGPPHFYFSDIVLKFLRQRWQYSQETWTNLGMSAQDSASAVGSSTASSSASAPVMSQSSASRARIHSLPKDIDDLQTAMQVATRDITAFKTTGFVKPPAPTSAKLQGIKLDALFACAHHTRHRMCVAEFAGFAMTRVGMRIAHVSSVAEERQCRSICK